MPAIALILSWLGRAVVVVVSLKALLITLSIVVLPAVLNNLFLDIGESAFSVISSNVHDGSLSPAVLQLTGMAAWIAEKMNLRECFSIILSGVAFKWSISFTPLGFLMGR